MFPFSKLCSLLEKCSLFLILPSPVGSFHFLSQEDTYSTILHMSASDDDSHILPNKASSDDDEDDDSEDEMLEPLVRLHDGKIVEPVVVAEVVPDAVAGVAAAAPPVNALAHHGVYTSFQTATGAGGPSRNHVYVTMPSTNQDNHEPS